VEVHVGSHSPFRRSHTVCSQVRLSHPDSHIIEPQSGFSNLRVKPSSTLPKTNVQVELQLSHHGQGDTNRKL